MKIEAKVLARELHGWLRENPGQGMPEIRQRFGIDDNQLARLLVMAENCGILFYEEMDLAPRATVGRRLIRYFAFVDKGGQ